MAFLTFTLDETHALLIALHKRHFPDIDVSEMSDAWLELRTFAGALTDNHAHTEATKNDLLPDTAEGDLLDRWGKIRGVIRKSATPARKSSAFRITGPTPGDPVPDGIALNHESGLRFKTVGATVLGATGYADVGIVGIDAGSATRLNKGEVLTFADPVAGLAEEGEMQLDMDEDGTDREADGAYRLRVLSRFSSPPLGGAQEDYVQWALAITGVAAAYCYPLRRGLGTVDVAMLYAGSGAVRLPDYDAVVAFQAVIDTKRPISVKACRVLLPADQETDVHYAVVPNGDPQYEFDWDDSIATTEDPADPWDAGTRRMGLTVGAVPGRPPTLKAGDRLVVADGATGRERVVQQLDGANAVILEADATGDEPSGAGSVLYAGGPLTQPTRIAILDLIDGLGTANPDSKRYGTWEGNLRTIAIGRVATAVSGVLDGELVAPVATVVAFDPAYVPGGLADLGIGLITPGQILVRRKH